MLSFLTKKPQEDKTEHCLDVLAPCSGRIIDITEVPDDVFAGKMMGDGMAVWQEKPQVCAPVDGIISMVADTKHAFGITTPEGLDILVHVGLETVELQGEGFEQIRQQGEEVKAGDVILSVDLDVMKDKGIEMVVPVLLIPNEEKDTRKTEETEAISGETVLFSIA